MRRSTRGWKVCAMAASFVVAAFAVTRAQQPASPARPATGDAAKSAERIDGVIIKVEPVDRAKSTRSSAEKAKPARRREPQALRLTINTAAVWRDWARDQATPNASESPKKAAERGAKSVATGGEPADKDTTVVIHLDPDSKVETRFRSPQDETTRGAKTPAKAREAETGSKETSANDARQAAKPVRFNASDLRPGLFVQVDFRHLQAGNRASTVTVIRPIITPAPAGGGDRR